MKNEGTLLGQNNKQTDLSLVTQLSYWLVRVPLTVNFSQAVVLCSNYNVPIITAIVNGVY